MSTKEKSSQLQTIGIEVFGVERLKTITEEFSEKLIIGRGGFGIVYKGKHQGKFIAVKKLFIKPETTQKDDELFENEVINAMLIPHHNNIVRLVGYCSTTNKEAKKFHGKRVFAENHYRLICFEYLPNGNLDSYIKDKSHVHWNERYNIIKGICRGLHYLHAKNILHLDLKPANVLLDERMIPKIGDFGLSRLRPPNEEQIHTINIKGTPGYMPIEYIKQGTISKKTDIYSLGVIVMEIIIAGERKYPDEQLEEVREKWKETSREEYEQVQKCIELALDCMKEEPEKRPDAKEVIEILSISNEDDMNHHPDGIEEHSEADPSSEELHGLHQRRTMTEDKRNSPLEILGSCTTPAVTVRTRLQRMMNSAFLSGVHIPIIGLVLAGILFSVLIFWVRPYIVSSYAKSRTITITVEEALFTRFGMVAWSSPPVLAYNFSVAMDIHYGAYRPSVTKLLEVYFAFCGQRFQIGRPQPRLSDRSALSSTLVSMAPLSGNVVVVNATYGEYMQALFMRCSLDVKLQMLGQVMYDDPLTLCNLEATCPFKLPEGRTGLVTLFYNVKCETEMWGCVPVPATKGVQKYIAPPATNSSTSTNPFALSDGSNMH